MRVMCVRDEGLGAWLKRAFADVSLPANEK